MKKQRIYICLFTIISITTINQNISASQNEEFYYNWGTIGNEQNTEYGKLIEDEAVKPEDSLLNRLMSIFNLNQPEYQWPQKAIYYIKKIINYSLSFASFIAFSLLLYSLYWLLIWDWDKQYTKVKETLKGVTIALLIMAIAWLIVSMLFWIYQKQAYIP